MTYELFHFLRTQAEDFSNCEAFIEDVKPYVLETDYKYLRPIHKYAKHPEFDTLAKICEQSRRSLANEYDISQRTVESWGAGVNRPPEYVIDCLAYAVLIDHIVSGKEPYIRVFKVSPTGEGKETILNERPCVALKTDDALNLELTKLMLENKKYHKPGLWYRLEIVKQDTKEVVAHSPWLGGWDEL